jgi:hypothetical protein
MQCVFLAIYSGNTNARQYVFFLRNHPYVIGTYTISNATNMVTLIGRPAPPNEFRVNRIMSGAIPF